MGIAERVREALNPMGMSSPTYELTEDPNGNVSGFVADSFFADLSDEEAQRKIWEQLRKELTPDEQGRVLAIFHETPVERAQRRSGDVGPGSERERFFQHTDRERARYWLFVDVTRVGDDYKAVFFLFCAKTAFIKSLSFVYSKEVIEFMELTGEDLYAELHRNAFGNGEAELKSVLMDKYTKLEDSGKVGENNPYWYVFNDFHMTPCPVDALRFDEAEVSVLEEHKKAFEAYSLWVVLDKATALSKLQNQIRGTSM